MKKFLIILAIGTIIWLGISLAIRAQNVFCGGFEGKWCSPGFACEYEGKFPDAGGKCVLLIDPLRLLK